MNVHGYELISDWKNSTSGQIARAQKGGKIYFLKKYQTPVKPIDNGTLDAKTFAHNRKKFEAFEGTRRAVNAAIRSRSGEGGNLIIPCEEFIEGNQLVEASEFVEGVVPKEELDGVLTSLSVDVKRLLMQTAAGALHVVHTLHIVHSDLKPENVLLVRNRAGNYVAKLVDFDSSYFVDKKPEDLIGTIDYYSPELGMCISVEDDREELEKNLTEKSDIFSMGLIFHYYLSGCLPTPVDLPEKLRKRLEKGKPVYCWVALNNGGKLQLSTKITDPLFIALINDMLSLDPNDRPSASEVLKRLKPGGKPVIEEPWPEHRIILDRDKLKADKIDGLKKIEKDGQKRYELHYETSGKTEVFTKEKLISKGYAREIGGDGPEPWPEHNIVFDQDKIKSRGFVSGERTVKDGVKGYTFYRANGTSTFFRVEKLLLMNYAKKTKVVPPPPPPGSSEPWPEHRIEFLEDAISAKGFVSVERVEKYGVKGYRLVRRDGSEQFLRVEMLLHLHLARKS
ncbi:MAG: hypothetical protein IKO83_09920 [Oscillospiraceae bacterium]|nr:hypothetical protein [Oscillospiraceae bacterium]